MLDINIETMNKLVIKDDLLEMTLELRSLDIFAVTNEAPDETKELYEEHKPMHQANLLVDSSPVSGKNEDFEDFVYTVVQYFYSQEHEYTLADLQYLLGRYVINITDFDKDALDGKQNQLDSFDSLMREQIELSSISPIYVLVLYAGIATLRTLLDYQKRTDSSKFKVDSSSGSLSTPQRPTQSDASGDFMSSSITFGKRMDTSYNKIYQSILSDIPNVFTQYPQYVEYLQQIVTRLYNTDDIVSVDDAIELLEAQVNQIDTSPVGYTVLKYNVVYTQIFVYYLRWYTFISNK
ncbi:hypothetical protein [Methanohalobium sp.]|uniref:hypothetical protein n=1 Tax=Methanohalobium sp. TaxID=2837493 RepID=UPI0025D520F7|nr:hypothetical protein [Methanohalobium sp.]